MLWVQGVRSLFFFKMTMSKITFVEEVDAQHAGLCFDCSRANLRFYSGDRIVIGCLSANGELVAFHADCWYGLNPKPAA